MVIIIPDKKDLFMPASGGIEADMLEKFSKTGKLRTFSKIARPHLIFPNIRDNFTCSLDFLCFRFLCQDKK